MNSNEAGDRASQKLPTHGGGTGILVGVASLLLPLVSLVTQVESTGAVPGDEFFLAGLLYGWLPTLRVLSTMSALMAAVRAQ